MTDKQKTKRLPLRTCIACREIKNKQDLIRLVKTPDKHLEIDLGGRREGRGMYICRKRECWEKALGDKWLDRVLQTKVSPENRDSLVEQSKNFITY